MLSNTFLFFHYSLSALSYRQMSIFYWSAAILNVLQSNPSGGHTHRIPILCLPNFKRLLRIKLTVGWKWLFWRCTTAFLSVHAPVCYWDTADLAKAGREQQMNPSSVNDTHCLHWSAACTEHIRHGLRHSSRRILCENTSLLHIICVFYSLCSCTFYRGVRSVQTQRRKEIIRIDSCASAKLEDRDLSMTSIII